MSTVLMSSKPEPLFKLIMSELKKLFPEHRFVLMGRNIKATDVADWLIYNYRDWTFYRGKDYQFHRPTILVDDQFKLEELPLLDCPDQMAFHISGDSQGIAQGASDLFGLLNNVTELQTLCQRELNQLTAPAFEHVLAELPVLLNKDKARFHLRTSESKDELLVLAPTFMEKISFFKDVYLNNETVDAENQRAVAILKCVQASDYFLVFNTPTGQLLYVANQKEKKVAKIRARRKVIGIY